MSECSLNAQPVPRGGVSACILMRHCLSNCESVNKPQKDEPHCAKELLSSIPWRTCGDGKDDVPVIGERAKISSTSAAARSFTIYTCWLVPNNSLLSFRALREFSTGALVLQRDFSGVY